MGCWNYPDQTNCEANTESCMWKSQSSGGWCEEVQCWIWDGYNGGDENACTNNDYGLACTWNDDGMGGGWCYQDWGGFSCTNMTSERDCMDTYWCWWIFNNPNDPSQGGNCTEPNWDVGEGGIFDEWNPGCYIFDTNQTACNNVTGCKYQNDACENLGSVGPKGLNCSLINDSALCNSIPTLSSCCVWQGSTCNSSRFINTCHDDMESPPAGAAFCEDYEAFTSATLCGQIAGSPWYMPCEWNNASSNCQFKKDDVFGNKTKSLLLLDNKQNCEFAGGLWLVENYCQGNQSVSTGHCEHKFDLQSTCDKVCCGCNYKSGGTKWNSTQAAEDACRASRTGRCEFTEDANAPNTQGYCKSKETFKKGVAKDCKTDCGACSFMGDPFSPQKYEGNSPSYKTCLAPSCYCKNSPNNCKWVPDPTYTTDESKGFCTSLNEKTCTDRCDKCFDEQPCNQNGQGGNNSCSWDSTMLICKATSGGDQMEICWDGVDNNDNGKMDCLDSMCFSDPFCGGGFVGDFANCAGYPDNATCTANNCTWMSEQWGAWCDSPGAICWKNDGDQTACEALGNCTWHSGGGGFCEQDWTQTDSCMGLNSSACSAANGSGCTWSVDMWCQDVGGWCEGGDTCWGRPQDTCTGSCSWYADPYCASGGGGWCDHQSFTCWQWNQAECAINGSAWCSWQDDPYSPEGGWCESGTDCYSYTTTQDCTDNSCSWTAGFCDPVGFGNEMGGGGGMQCFMHDGNMSGCIDQTGCGWMTEMNPFCEPNFDASCPQYSYNESVCVQQEACIWMGEAGGSGWCDHATFNCSSLTETPCGTNDACFWSGSNCQPGCFNPTVDTANECINIVDNQANRVCAWRDGWCNSAMTSQMFGEMEMGAPIMLGMDPMNDADPNTGSLDVVGFGMKDMGDSYGFGMGVREFTNSSVCYGEKMMMGGTGQGKDTGKYFWYLDTNGNKTGGCALNHNSSSVGWDFYFKYQAVWDPTEGSTTETTSSYKCVGGSWGAADIKLSTYKMFMCNEINGPMIAVPKADMDKFNTLYDATADLRVAISSAGNTTNMTNPADYADPGWTTPGSIDFDIMDMSNVEAMDSAKFEELMCKGFTNYEECLNSVDDDGDGLVDCADYDCQFSQRCNVTGVNLAGYEDTRAPIVEGVKIENYRDSLLVMYDTNKPTNGTVMFYHNNSQCTGLANTTIYDIGIRSSTVQAYKMWHVADIYNDNGVNSLAYALSPDTQYYYKIQVCDTGGKCAISKCTEIWTASADKCGFCDFVARIRTPADWKVKYDTDKNGVYEHVQGEVCGANAGMRINYTVGRSVNIRLERNDSSTYIEFFNASITRTGLNYKVGNVSNSDAFSDGTTTNSAGGSVSYSGMASETRDKIINNLHPELCYVRLPNSTSCNQLWHCEDDFGTCIEMTNVTGTARINASPCIWQVPYCEFSRWTNGEPGTSTPAATTGGGGSGGAGGGGGGGGGGDTGTSSRLSWSEIRAGKDGIMTINSTNIPVKKVTFRPNVDLTGPALKVSSYSEKPDAIKKYSGKVYKYLRFTTENMPNARLASIEVEFEVDKSWLSLNGLKAGDISLFRYVGNKTKIVPTENTGSKTDVYKYTSDLPGFSYFVIGEVVKEEVPEKIVDEKPEVVVEPPAITGDVIEAPVSLPEDKRPWLGWMVVMLLFVAGCLMYFVGREHYFKRTKGVKVEKKE